MCSLDRLDKKISKLIVVYASIETNPLTQGSYGP